MNEILSTLIKKIVSPELSSSNIIKWGAPIPSFGDSSTSTVATLGLNPSNREFVDDNGDELHGEKRRFHTLRSLGITSWDNIKNQHINLIHKSCNEYFFNNPYDNWFKSLDSLISGLGVSYYSKNLPAACHLDLVPYATNKKWGHLTTFQQKQLLKYSDNSLATILHNSPIRILILNGASVIKGLNSTSTIKLTKTEMPSWALPRKSGNDIKGYAYKGKLINLLDTQFNKEILVLGFNHNIQSSFGVTNVVKNNIKDWLQKQSTEIAL
ncbi:MAG: hypothetical protein QM500_12010 [Methylococcales bacterium]